MSQIERETMELDLLVVGGGSAGLSAALWFAKQAKEKAPDREFMIGVVEKGAEIGAHSFSGAVLNPKALRELHPAFLEDGCPLESEVKTDALYYFRDESAIKFPVTPSPFHNVGNYIISLSKFNRWLGAQCEAAGVNIFPGFAAVEALYEGDRVIGVRTGDKGVDKNGQPKSNFEPGLLLKAKVTIFAEGTRGSLFKQVAKKLNLWSGKNPEVFEEGVKEIIQLPKGSIEAGQVIHSMGFPLSKSIGGTFIYTLPDDKVIVGLVAYLDSHDPLLDPHRELQKLKTHPFLRKMLSGGQVIHYGGKTLPAGGYFSMPKLHGQGWMVIGDSASMVDVQRLKGIHLGMKAGMLAAETALESILTDSETLKAYETKIENSYIKDELYRVRNFHQTLSQGMLFALPQIAIQEITGGRGIFDKMPVHEDSKATENTIEVWGPRAFEEVANILPKPDGKLFFDKLSSVYLSGTLHDENSPNHLLLKNGDVCRDQCEPNYRSPCTHFCPAAVYEMVDSSAIAGKKDLMINYTNCIHCKTCDIKCPFVNLEWTVPEGGGGPRYTDT